MSNFMGTSKSQGNKAHRHTIHNSVSEGNAYQGTAGEVSFIVCAGYMVGVLHDGVCRGGIARWPLFNPDTDFLAMYDLVNPAPAGKVPAEDKASLGAKG